MGKTGWGRAGKRVKMIKWVYNFVRGWRKDKKVAGKDVYKEAGANDRWVGGWIGRQYEWKDG